MIVEILLASVKVNCSPEISDPHEKLLFCVYSVEILSEKLFSFRFFVLRYKIQKGLSV